MYTRFLLPALPVMTVLAALVLLSAARRIAPRAPVATAAVVCAIVAALSIRSAASLAVFGMREGEQKYPRVGGFVREQLPAAAFVMAAQHSGSITYYSGRPTLRWDLLDAASLDRAIARCGVPATSHTSCSTGKRTNSSASISAHGISRRSAG